MTALKEYDRLESGGLWRAGPDAQRRDAVVSFGDATLVIADGAGRPLAHWSLPAVTRLNPGQRPALFAPDAETEAGETLEVADELMINAIEKVRRSLARARPKPGKLRHWITAGVVAGAAALAVFWLPGALHDQTLAVVPAAKRMEIGATVLGHMQAQSGPTCRGQQGRAALAMLRTRLLGRDSNGQIVVLPADLPQAIALPGDIIVLGRAMVETGDDPALPAGHVLAAHTERVLRDPLAPVLATGGLRETMRLLTTGDVDPSVLKRYAETLMQAAPTPPPTSDLIAVFDAAAVPTSLYAENVASEATVELKENDPMTGRAIPEILPDGVWVSLQGICDL